MYDADGRLVESRPEPEWDDAEREWFLALDDVRRKEEAERCHLCGLPKAVCRAKSTEAEVKVEAERCFVATARARAQSQMERDGMEYVGAVDWIPMVKNPLDGFDLPL